MSDLGGGLAGQPASIMEKKKGVQRKKQLPEGHAIGAIGGRGGLGGADPPGGLGVLKGSWQSIPTAGAEPRSQPPS
jgi:hypothetical protein